MFSRLEMVAQWTKTAVSSALWFRAIPRTLHRPQCEPLWGGGGDATKTSRASAGQSTPCAVVTWGQDGQRPPRGRRWPTPRPPQGCGTLYPAQQVGGPSEGLLASGLFCPTDARPGGHLLCGEWQSWAHTPLRQAAPTQAPCAGAAPWQGWGSSLGALVS